MFEIKDEEGIVDQNVDQEDCTLDDDPFDILEPVNILEKLPSNFYQLVNKFYINSGLLKCVDKTLNCQMLG